MYFYIFNLYVGDGKSKARLNGLLPNRETRALKVGKFILKASQPLFKIALFFGCKSFLRLARVEAFILAREFS